MAGQASLAVNQMTERGLWNRLAQNIAAINSYGFTNMKSSEVRAKAAECWLIVAELRMRGTQTQLELELGER